MYISVCFWNEHLLLKLMQCSKNTSAGWLMPNSLQQTKPGLPFVRRDKITLERFIMESLSEKYHFIGSSEQFCDHYRPSGERFFVTQLEDERKHLTDSSEV